MAWAIFAAASSYASSLDILPAAAHTGSQGLRVTVGTSCSGAQDEVVDGQVLAGPQVVEGCESITSSSTTISSGDVTFRAGERIVLGDGFVVQSGAGFVAAVDASLTPDAYLEDHTLKAQRHYGAGFFLNADGLSLGSSDRFELFTGLDNGDRAWFLLILKRDAALGENRLVLESRRNDGTYNTTEGLDEVALPAGWSWVSIEWKALTPAGLGGYFELYLGGVFQATTGAFNSNGRIDKVLLGAVSVEAGTSGSFDLDGFVSRIAGPIPPP